MTATVPQNGIYPFTLVATDKSSCYVDVSFNLNLNNHPLSALIWTQQLVRDIALMQNILVILISVEQSLPGSWQMIPSKMVLGKTVSASIMAPFL
jgi:hypothetical protein